MSTDSGQQTIGDELGTLRRPVAWTLLALTGVLLVIPTVGLLLPGDEPGVDTLPQRALVAAGALGSFPLLLMPVLAVLLARGTGSLRQVGRVAAVEYGVIVLLGLVTVGIVAANMAAIGQYDGIAHDVYLFTLTHLVQAAVAVVGLVVTLRLSRPQQ
jgi:membrane protease YdiL (CAAX protease family)